MPVSVWIVYFYLFLYRFHRFLYITTSKDKFGEKCRELLTGNSSQGNCRRQQRMTFLAKIHFSLIIVMHSPGTKLVMFKRLPFTALSLSRVRSMWSLEITQKLKKILFSAGDCNSLSIFSFHQLALGTVCPRVNTSLVKCISWDGRNLHI